MTTIAILPERGEDELTAFRAVAAERVATGRTPGEALDALTLQLSADKTFAPVIIQRFRPDRFFPAAKRERLSSLMARWRAARDAGGALPPSEQADLEKLVDEELQAMAERAAAISRDFERVRSTRPKLAVRNTRLHRYSLVAGFLLGLLLVVMALIFVSSAGLQPNIATRLSEYLAPGLSYLVLAALGLFSTRPAGRRNYEK